MRACEDMSGETGGSEIDNRAIKIYRELARITDTLVHEKPERAQDAATTAQQLQHNFAFSKKLAATVQSSTSSSGAAVTSYVDAAMSDAGDEDGEEQDEMDDAEPVSYDDCEPVSATSEAQARESAGTAYWCVAKLFDNGEYKICTRRDEVFGDTFAIEHKVEQGPRSVLAPPKLLLAGCHVLQPGHRGAAPPGSGIVLAHGRVFSDAVADMAVIAGESSTRSRKHAEAHIDLRRKVRGESEFHWYDGESFAPTRHDLCGGPLTVRVSYQRLYPNLDVHEVENYGGSGTVNQHLVSPTVVDPLDALLREVTPREQGEQSFGLRKTHEDFVAKFVNNLDGNANGRDEYDRALFDSLTYKAATDSSRYSHEGLLYMADQLAAGLFVSKITARKYDNKPLTPVKCACAPTSQDTVKAPPHKGDDADHAAAIQPIPHMPLLSVKCRVIEGAKGMLRTSNGSAYLPVAYQHHFALEGGVRLVDTLHRMIATIHSLPKNASHLMPDPRAGDYFFNPHDAAEATRRVERLEQFTEELTKKADHLGVSKLIQNRSQLQHQFATLLLYGVSQASFMAEVVAKAAPQDAIALKLNAQPIKHPEPFLAFQTVYDCFIGIRRNMQVGLDVSWCQGVVETLQHGRNALGIDNKNLNGGGRLWVKEQSNGTVESYQAKYFFDYSDHRWQKEMQATRSNPHGQAIDCRPTKCCGEPDALFVGVHAVTDVLSQVLNGPFCASQRAANVIDSLKPWPSSEAMKEAGDEQKVTLLQEARDVLRDGNETHDIAPMGATCVVTPAAGIFAQVIPPRVKSTTAQNVAERLSNRLGASEDLAKDTVPLAIATARENSILSHVHHDQRMVDPQDNPWVDMDAQQQAVGAEALLAELCLPMKGYSKKKDFKLFDRTSAESVVDTMIKCGIDFHANVKKNWAPYQIYFASTFFVALHALYPWGTRLGEYVVRHFYAFAHPLIAQAFYGTGSYTKFDLFTFDDVCDKLKRLKDDPAAVRAAQEFEQEDVEVGAILQRRFTCEDLTDELVDEWAAEAKAWWAAFTREKAGTNAWHDGVKDILVELLVNNGKPMSDPKQWRDIRNAHLKATLAAWLLRSPDGESVPPTLGAYAGRCAGVERKDFGREQTTPRMAVRIPLKDAPPAKKGGVQYAVTNENSEVGLVGPAFRQLISKLIGAHEQNMHPALPRTVQVVQSYGLTSLRQSCHGGKLPKATCPCYVNDANHKEWFGDHAKGDRHALTNKEKEANLTNFCLNLDEYVPLSRQRKSFEERSRGRVDHNATPSDSITHEHSSRARKFDSEAAQSTSEHNFHKEIHAREEHKVQADALMYEACAGN